MIKEPLDRIVDDELLLDLLKKKNRDPWLPVYIGIGIVVITAGALGISLFVWFYR
jgi:high-affinity Fe2+/Pb2+ permease